MGCLLLGLLAATSGCAPTTHVAGGIQAGVLAAEHKAVAVMRLGSPNPSCLHAGVLLGVRDGAGFKPIAPVKVANISGLSNAPVGEIELDAGEYHVIAISCVARAGQAVVGEKSITGLYRTSYAHFTLAPGEIVNVGYIHLDAAKIRGSLFGRGVLASVEVSDWPLDEIERYKSQRPELTAQMQTRLMVVGDDPETEEQQVKLCARWRQAKADGLAQSIPSGCAQP